MRFALMRTSDHAHAVPCMLLPWPPKKTFQAHGALHAYPHWHEPTPSIASMQLHNQSWVLSKYVATSAALQVSLSHLYHIKSYCGHSFFQCFFEAIHQLCWQLLSEHERGGILLTLSCNIIEFTQGLGLY